MQNTVLPESEVTLVKEAISKVDEIIKNHENLEPNLEESNNQLIRIHTMLYLNMVKDFVSTANALKTLLECSEEEFTKKITKDGKMTVDEAEKNLMMNMLMDLITN